MSYTLHSRRVSLYITGIYTAESSSAVAGHRRVNQPTTKSETEMLKGSSHA